jgi:hypothetical protein
LTLLVFFACGRRTKAIRRGYAVTDGRGNQQGETLVRTIFLIALAGTALALAGTDARAAPWCANYSPDNGTNCGFYTIEQCRRHFRASAGPARPIRSKPAPIRAGAVGETKSGARHPFARDPWPDPACAYGGMPIHAARSSSAISRYL